MSKSEFAIDPNKLDEDWVGQPILMDRYGRELADARLAYEQAKSKLEVKTAELDLEIRSDPQKFGLDKTTEKAIDNVIATNKMIQQGRSAVLKARHAMDVISAATTTLDHRKKALENLVQLQSIHYYSEPRTHPEARESIEETRKQKTRRATQRRAK